MSVLDAVAAVGSAILEGCEAFAFSEQPEEIAFIVESRGVAYLQELVVRGQDVFGKCIDLKINIRLVSKQ